MKLLSLVISSCFKVYFILSDTNIVTPDPFGYYLHGITFSVLLLAAYLNF
jgi:hypothetical protein